MAAEFDLDPLVEELGQLERIVFEEELDGVHHVLQDFADDVLDAEVTVEERIEGAHFGHEVPEEAIDEDPNNLLDGLIFGHAYRQKIVVNRQQEIL